MKVLKVLVIIPLLMLGMLSCPVSAANDDFSSRRVTLLVPFAAGGTLDILARQLAERLSDTWGQRVLVENRPGAGGIIASRELINSPPDGHTLLLVASGHAINPLMYSQLPYDTLKDFTPIALLAKAGNVILVPANSPYKTFADLLAAARAKPGMINYGTAGVGTSVHLSGELIKYLAGADIVPVPFKGDTESLAAVIGDQIPMSINAAPAAIAQTRQGTVRALAVTSSERSTFLSDVPTVAEAGVPGYAVDNWWGIVGPGKMPPEVVTFLNTTIRTAMKNPATADRLKSLAVEVSTGSADDFGHLIRNEMDKWAPVVKAAGIKLDAK